MRVSVSSGIVVGTLTALLLSGCAIPMTQMTTTPRPVMTPPSPSASASVSPSDPGRSDAMWISLTTSGGIDGRYSRVLVTGNGRVIVTPEWKATPIEYQLTSEELDNLRATVDAAPWDTFQGQYPNMAADVIGYNVIFNGQTVDVDELSIPDGLRPVIGALSQIESRSVPRLQLSQD